MALLILSGMVQISTNKGIVNQSGIKAYLSNSWLISVVSMNKFYIFKQSQLFTVSAVSADRLQTDFESII